MQTDQNTVQQAQELERARQQAQQQVRQDYEQRKERTAALTNATLRVTETSEPTPTQEENDLAKLGLLHPDEKSQRAAPEMPPLAAQQAYLASGEGKVEPVTPQAQQRTVPRPPPPAPPRAPERRSE